METKIKWQFGILMTIIIVGVSLFGSYTLYKGQFGGFNVGRQESNISSGMVSRESRPICPVGSTVITQADINLANNNNSNYVIRQPGSYCLGEDIITNYSTFSYAGIIDPVVISIKSSSVTLNLNNHRIINTDASKRMLSGNQQSQLTAIDINNFPTNLTGITIQGNGEIHGFDIGVGGRFSSEVHVKNIRFFQNANSIAFFELAKSSVLDNIIEETFNGIYFGVVVGPGFLERNYDITVRNNRISLGSSKYARLFSWRGIGVTQVEGKADISDNVIYGVDFSARPFQQGQGSDPAGIVIGGENIEVRNNTISDTVHGIWVSGIEINVSGNNITDSATIIDINAYPLVANEKGIIINATNGISIANNNIKNYYHGIYFEGSSYGHYSNNTICNAVIPVHFIFGANQADILDRNNSFNAPNC